MVLVLPVAVLMPEPATNVVKSTLPARALIETAESKTAAHNRCFFILEAPPLAPEPELTFLPGSQGVYTVSYIHSHRSGLFCDCLNLFCSSNLSTFAPFGPPNEGERLTSQGKTLSRHRYPARTTI